MDCRLTERLTRREFLSFAGLGAVSLGFAPAWLARAAAAMKSSSRRTLVVLFQRGAADGLNIVPPFREPLYHKARPSIRIAPPSRGSPTLDLDGRFGLHPRLSDLAPLWRQGRFAVVQAVGSQDASRSHFEAQDHMERALPGAKEGRDGWLNRALNARGRVGNGLAAVAISSRLPLSLKGSYPVLAMSRLDELRASEGMMDLLESMYDEETNAPFSESIRHLREVRKIIKGVSRQPEADFGKMGYPNRRVGRDFFELAGLIKADVGLRVGFLDMDGWDHHRDEGALNGELGNSLHALGGSIAAFYRHLGDRAEDVLLITMTEFGRTIEENGSGGTDHGHASVMLIFGGRVKGGKVYGRWPGLEKENLFEGRDLEATTDYRQVLSEALSRHMGIDDLGLVFPGGSFPHLGYL